MGNGRKKIHINETLAGDGEACEVVGEVAGVFPMPIISGPQWARHSEN